MRYSGHRAKNSSLGLKLRLETSDITMPKKTYAKEDRDVNSDSGSGGGEKLVGLREIKKSIQGLQESKTGKNQGLVAKFMGSRIGCQAYR